MIIEDVANELGIVNENSSSNEPPHHQLVKRSFFQLATAGLRSAPEVLVLELFRELFFEDFSGDGKVKELHPSEYNTEGQAILYALRGRQKSRSKKLSTEYYAPAYPVLAKHAWFRKNSDRVIRDFLLRGPIAQHFLNNKDNSIEDFVSLVITALFGHNSTTSSTDLDGKEILSIPLAKEMKEISIPEAKNKLLDLINTVQKEEGSTLDLHTADPLASRIFKDFSEICQLEASLPRLQWIAYLKTYLRISTATWLLAQMQFIIYLRDWLLLALSGTERLPTDDEILEIFKKRHIKLLHPMKTATLEIDEHVEQYMKARVEVSIIMHLIGHFKPELNKYDSLVSINKASKKLPVVELLTIARSTKEDLYKKYLVPLNLENATVLTRRLAEFFHAWNTPLKRGQGKNYEEFLRVIRRGFRDEDLDEGYLVTPSDRRNERSFIIFPGPMAIKLFTFLAHRNLYGKGKLLISDLELTFEEYGLDFSSSAGGRDELIQKLHELALLKGSPDAGDSAEIKPPVTVRQANG